MSLTTPSNTLNTFTLSGPFGWMSPICHDLVEWDDSSAGKGTTPVQCLSGTGHESGTSAALTACPQG